MIKSGIEESFGNVQGTNVVMDVNINTDPEKVKGTDHIFAFVDANTLTNSTGKPVGGRNVDKKTGKGKIGGEKMLISTATILHGANQVKRTGAHEFGHGCYLEHPKDANGRVLRQGNNLMIQSQDSKGMEINKNQIEKAHKMINEQK